MEIQQNLKLFINEMILLIKTIEKERNSSKLCLLNAQENIIKTEFDKLLCLINYQASKLAILVKNNHKESLQILQELQTAIKTLPKILFQIPFGQGECVFEDLKSGICDIISNSASFANSLLTEPITSIDSDFHKMGYLPSAGLLWESLENLKLLSINNKQASIKRLGHCLDLIVDAKHEVEEKINIGITKDFGWDELEDESDDEEQEENIIKLSEIERNSAIKCASLIKCSKLLVEKIMKIIKNTNPEPDHKIDQIVHYNQLLDEIVSCSRVVTNCIDDLCMLVDTKMSIRDLGHSASILADKQSELVIISRGISGMDAVQKWFDTCSSQIWKILEKLLERDSLR